MKPTAPRWAECTALFGGTFAPPHLGHEEAIDGLFQNPGVRRVWIMPAGLPNLKQTLTSADHRFTLARLAFESIARRHTVEILDLEIKRARENPGQRTTTYETLQALRSHEPNLAVVIGTDQLASISQWHRFPELLGLAHWIVLERKPHGRDLALATLQQWQTGGLARPVATQPELWELPQAGRTSTWLHLVETPARDVSSTQIRMSCEKTGQAPENTLNPAVEEYLKQHSLYGTRLKR